MDAYRSDANGRDRRTGVRLAVLAGFCLLIYFSNLGGWDLWNPDEPRYGQVAREMVQTGDWIVMHRNGDIYTEKPPLFFWFIALVSLVAGNFTSFTVRFPAAVFGTLTVLVTFFIGKRLFNERAGLLGGLVLSTTGLYAYMATRGNIDTTLTFFTTAAIYCFICWYYRGEDDQDRPGNLKGLSFWGFYGSLGLATLAKGPVGFIIPLLVILVFLVVRREGRLFIRLRPGRGLLLLVAIVLAWYVPAYLSGGDRFLENTLLRQTVGRFAEGVSKNRPFYYFFMNFPLDFLPWFFFLPGALILGLRRKDGFDRRRFAFLATWFIVTFLFFSISKGKRELYLLPLYPGAALMVGHLFDKWLRDRLFAAGRWMIIPVLCLAATLIAGGAGAIFAVRGYAPEFGGIILPLALILVAAGLLLGWLILGGKHGAVHITIVAVMAIVLVYGQVIFFPRLNPYKSARPIAEELARSIGIDGKAAIFGDIEPGPYNFYSGIVPITPVRTGEEIRAFLREAPKAVILARADKVPELREEAGGVDFREKVRRRVGSHEMVLLLPASPATGK